MASTEGIRGEKGKVFSINRSLTKGTTKSSLKEGNLIENFGLEGDAHAGAGSRQVSLLAIESIAKQAECPKVGKESGFGPGDFAENITTQGLNLTKLKVGDNLTIGRGVVLKICKIGKQCHRYCAIYQRLGDCIMPREGIFAEVLKGGRIAVGDEIEVVHNV